MIEIGNSLPNLTDPAATTGAAEMLAFKALSLFPPRPCRAAATGSTYARVFHKSGYRFCDQNTRKLSMRSRISGLRHGLCPAAPQAVRRDALMQFRRACAGLRPARYRRP